MRAALALVAVVLCAFFALAVRQATSENDARARISLVEQSPAAARRTAALLDHAGRLRPGTEIDLLRAKFALEQHDNAKARRILRDITRREPANAEAWGSVLLAFQHSDPGFAREARAALRRYAPSVPAP